MATKNIPLLDCPIDFLIGDASGKTMNEYGTFPCKIKCGVYAYMVRGSAKATINITQYEFHENDFLLIESGSFLLIHEFTDDALVYYILFSSSFLEKNTFNSRIPMESLQIKSPILHLTTEMGAVMKHFIDLLMEASNCEPSMLSSAKMVHIYSILQLQWKEYAMQVNKNVIQPIDRKTEIYQTYCTMVLEHYHEWRSVARYAEEIRISLPHLCSTVKSVSGKTASDLIIDAIITDAKAQLKITNLQAKEIAVSLGFQSIGAFHRFFKAHTGMTPKAYRNS